MAEHATTDSPSVADGARSGGEAVVSDALASAREGLSGMIPQRQGVLGRTVYSTSYAISYGVVFPTMLVARALPRDNALFHGLADGAEAARERVFGWEDSQEHEETAGSEEAGQSEGDSDGEGQEATRGSSRNRRRGRQRGGANPPGEPAARVAARPVSRGRQGSTHHAELIRSGFEVPSSTSVPLKMMETLPLPHPLAWR